MLSILDFNYQQPGNKIPPLSYKIRMTPMYSLKYTENLYPAYLPDGLGDSRKLE